MLIDLPAYRSRVISDESDFSNVKMRKLIKKERDKLSYALKTGYLCLWFNCFFNKPKYTLLGIFKPILPLPKKIPTLALQYKPNDL